MMELTLAKTYVPSEEARKKINGWVYSEKLDGCRGYYDPATKSLYSRNGNNFNMPEEYMEDFGSESLDGEIYMGPHKYSEMAGLLNRKDKSDLDLTDIKFVVFDRPSIEGNYFKRMPKTLKFKSKNIVALPYYPITEETDLEKILETVELKGGEGLILRNPKTEYEHKRTSNLLKYVSSYTAEGLVIGHNDGKGRNEGRLGSLRVKTKIDDKEMTFNVSGFTDEQRNNAKELFPIGKTYITFKYREITKTGSPRFPVFVRIRDEI